MNIEQRLREACSKLEDAGKDELSFVLSAMGRRIRCAKTTEIKLDSWDDFVTWWAANRSETLIYSLIDELGEDSPIVKQLQELLQKSEEFDRELHSVYIALKSGTQPATPVTPTPVSETEQSAIDELDLSSDE